MAQFKTKASLRTAAKRGEDAIASNTAQKFELEKQIEKAESQRTQLEQQIEDLEGKLQAD